MVRCYIPTLHNVRNKTKKCTARCPVHCQEHEFNINKEISPLPEAPHPEMRQQLGLNGSQVEEYIEDQVFGIAVRYRKKREKRETYQPLVSLVTLLGTIGGSIGLGMGLSLLTVVEFALFLVDSLQVMLLRREINKHNLSN